VLRPLVDGRGGCGNGLRRARRPPRWGRARRIPLPPKQARGFRSARGATSFREAAVTAAETHPEEAAMETTTTTDRRPDDRSRAGSRARPVIYHIPVCPFSQRLEILLALKDRRDAVDFHVIDITRPRPDWLVAKTGGPVPLPVLETETGGILRESLVLLGYLEQRLPDPPIARADPYEHAVESMLVAREGAFGTAGYAFVMNRDRDRRDAFRERMEAECAGLDAFLRRYATGEPFLFDGFGWAETVFTPLFMRFWFLDYYENWDIPDSCGRLRAWRDACIAHPAAQQVSREEVVKLYHDYALGCGNGRVPEGRRLSSFVFEPDWRDRPWPPRDKWGRPASDADLGLA
jgi:glutathione S-transferase